VVEEVDWAHTTVKTLMSRLVEKGALEAWQEGKTTHYRALLPRSRARASAARALLEKAFDGAVGPLVHHLVRTQRLSEADRRELERLLREEAEASASPGEAEEGAG
jgi:predicted transcriptional regulator